jgi:hypothetical protein
MESPGFSPAASSGEPGETHPTSYPPFRNPKPGAKACGPDLTSPQLSEQLEVSQLPPLISGSLAEEEVQLQ